MYVINPNRSKTTYRNEALETWMRTIRDYKVLSVAEEEKLIKEIKDGNSESINTLIKSNQRFLLSAARTYSRYADEILDLISEGNLALLHAIKNYNPKYNIKFLSYAAWWIRRYMSDYYKKNTLVKHRIDSTLDSFIKTTKEEFRKENGFEIPDYILNELATDEFDRDFKQGGSYFKRINVYFDDDIKPDDYDGDSVIERLTCVENEALSTLNNEDIVTTATTLVDNVCQNQMERDVIIYGYGLFDNPKLSDFEIGLKYDISEIRVAHLRKKIINHMILYANDKKLKSNKSKFQEKNAEQRKTRGRSTGNRVHKPRTYNPHKNV